MKTVTYKTIATLIITFLIGFGLMYIVSPYIHETEDMTLYQYDNSPDPASSLLYIIGLGIILISIIATINVIIDKYHKLYV